MTQIQIIPGDFQITDPSWPRVNLWRPGRIFTSDNFSSASGSIVGKRTNAALGGQPVMWEGDTPGWTATGGRLAAPTGLGAALVAVPGQDYELAMSVPVMPTSGELQVNLRRAGLAAGLGTNTITIRCFASGTVSIRETYAGITSQLGSATGALSAGSTLTVRVEGNEVIVEVNGVEVTRGTTQVMDGIYAGVTVSAAGVGAMIDNFTVTAL